MKTLVLNASLSSIEQAIRFVSGHLDNYKCPGLKKAKALLTLEEVLALQIINTTPNEKITVSVSKFLKNISLKVTGKGGPVHIADIRNNIYASMDNDEETKEVLDNLFNRLADKALNYKRSGERNTFEIKVSDNVKSIYLTLGSLISGILFGLLAKNLLPLNIITQLTDNLLSPIYTMFITCLKMIVAPLVFFSIAASITDLKDLKVFGRMALKIVGFYLLTSMFAISAGFISTAIFPIGHPGLQSIINDTASGAIEIASSVNVSIRDTIVGIIPGNIVDPFVKGNMLQIIFLAIMLGICSALVGSDNYFNRLIKDGNVVFSKFTAIIIHFMPVAIFCSMAKLTVNMDISNLLQVFVWIPGLYIGYLIMLVVYGVLLRVFGKVNPLKFYKNITQVMSSAISTCSSNATMPVTMKACEENLKISPVLFSFSIPLGATINMDGVCAMLVVSAMFAARVFSITVTPSFIMSLIIVIITLSIGAPGVPGGGLICLTILLPSIGIPQEFVSIIMGLYSINEMGQTLINVTGDTVVTYLVAKSEGLVKE